MAQDQHPLSDDEIIAAERRKLKTGVLIAPLFGLAAFGGLFLLVFARRLGVSEASLGWMLQGYFLLLMLGMAYFGWRFRLSHEARSDRIMRKRIDELQGHYRITLIFFIVLAGSECFGMDRSSSLFVQFLFLFFFVCAAVAISFGRGLISGKLSLVQSDERMRALRSQASRAGYLGLMAALGAIYMAGVYRPDLVPLLVRTALFAGVAIPAATFVFLDWRTGG